MINILRSLGDRFLENGITNWLIERPARRLLNYLDFRRDLTKLRKSEHKHLLTVEKYLSTRQNDLVVENGPFKGIKYPSAHACGSELVPKLIGSYEFELHAIIDRCCSKGYDIVIDVGCAEGYYAIGFASRIKKARIYAADLDPNARDLCQQMARGNGVEGRVCMRELFCKEDFSPLVKNHSCLVISDCEGFELELFAGPAIEALKNADVLIECHDRVVANATSILVDRFSATHTIHFVNSVDTQFRRIQYTATINGAFTKEEITVLMKERTVPMVWLFLESISRG